MSELGVFGGEPLDVVAAWLFTYLLHSTLLLGGMWILLKFRDLRPAWEETLWKVALFGPLLTAAAHATADVDPLLEAWDVTLLHRAWGAAQPASTSAGSLLAAGESGFLAHWRLILALAWAAGALFQLATLVRRNRRLIRTLAGRRPPDSHRAQVLRRSLLALGPSSRPRISVLEGIGTPLALGRREVVVPPDLVDRLEEAALRGVMAHELAHLVRRDPLWSLASGIGGALCFFQPLWQRGRTRLEELAEIRADAWAIEHTGDPLALAKGLEGIARSLVDKSHPVTAGLGATGDRPGGLPARVSRILKESSLSSRSASDRPRVAVGVAILAATLFVVPAFTSLHEREDDASEFRPGDDDTAFVRTLPPGYEPSVAARPDRAEASPS